MAGDLVALPERRDARAAVGAGLPSALVDRLPAPIVAAMTVAAFAPEAGSTVRLNLPMVAIGLPGALHRQDIADALAVAEKGLQAAGAADALLATARMRVATRQRAMAPDDEALQLALYGEKLGKYPVAVVAAACEAWLETSPFWPSVSEILEACERAIQPRRELVLVLTRKLREIGNA